MPHYGHSFFCISTSEVILFSVCIHLTVVNQPFNHSFLNDQYIPCFFLHFGSCALLKMDQGNGPIIYTCTLCNIWTMAKSHGQVTRCMRCSNTLKLVEVGNIYTFLQYSCSSNNKNINFEFLISYHRKKERRNKSHGPI